MSPDAYIEMAEMQATHWWFAARREILRSQIERLSLPSGADILEVGSGTGANLALLSRFGNVVALEVAPEAIALAQARCVDSARPVTMRQGRCPEDLGAMSERFDLICLFDVLEHIERDADSLAKLALLLKPNGTLMATLPAYSWMWGPHDVRLHHKRRYSRRQLSHKCAQAGLEVSRMSHFNTILFPVAVLGRLLEKVFRKATVTTTTPPAPINTILARLFALERHCLARMQLPFGLSILLLANARRA